MSSPSEQVLKQMRQDRQGEGKSSKKQDPYSKLIIDKSKRRLLFVLSLLALGTITLLLSRASHSSEPWWIVGLGPMAIGGLLALFPLTESWDYQPWQSAARQYEHHYSGQ